MSWINSISFESKLKYSSFPSETHPSFLLEYDLIFRDKCQRILFLIKLRIQSSMKVLWFQIKNCGRSSQISNFLWSIDSFSSNLDWLSILYARMIWLDCNSTVKNSLTKWSTEILDALTLIIYFWCKCFQMIHYLFIKGV